MTGGDILDVLIPRQLVVPSETNEARSNISGALVLSGAKLYFNNGTNMALVTSA